MAISTPYFFHIPRAVCHQCSCFCFWTIYPVLVLFSSFLLPFESRLSSLSSLTWMSQLMSQDVLLRLPNPVSTMQPLYCFQNTSLLLLTSLFFFCYMSKRIMYEQIFTQTSDICRIWHLLVFLASSPAMCSFIPCALTVLALFKVLLVDTRTCCTSWLECSPSLVKKAFSDLPCWARLSVVCCQGVLFYEIT